LALTTIAFDIAGLEIFGPLSFGHKAVIASKKATMDPFLLMELIDKHNVNYMQATPATWRLLIDASWQGKKDITLLTGGEALPEDLANQLPLLCDTLWNCYGPTEATIWSMVRKVESVVLDPFDSQYVGSEDIEAGLADLDCSGLINTSSKSSIGGPLANYQHFILNKSQNLVPLGAIGELYIAGPSLAHGYFNRPDLTAINFIDVTLSGFDMRRLYRTGDLVRYLACGNMEFVGRVDEQVKIRGFRIELGEIESRLSKVEAISSCIVIVDESEQEKRLIAYVIQSETCQLTEDEFISIINQTLKNDLPDYMVPSAYVIMAKWPLTANGKVDKKALPKNNITVMDGKYQAPSSNTEKNLVKIWGALLKLDTKSISINANFFNVGGHSLLALRMISEIRAQLAIELSLADIFNYPELKSIATLIDNSERTSQFMRPAITAVDRKVLGKAFSENSHEISLSFAQRRLWFIDRVGGGSPEYNMPTAVVIEGDIDLIIVERALTEIIQRHEPLRTVFAERDGEPVQVIRDEIDFTLQQIDLRRLPKSEQETQLTKLLAENARCVFNLNQDLMLRATFFHLTAENQQAKGVLQFNMHHIASDGWSLGLVNKEFAELYQAFSAGLPSPLQPLTIQYADYAHWQQELLEGHLLTEQLAYWKTQLRDVPTVHSLPLDRPRKSNKGYVSQTLESTMPLKLSSMIKALATKNKLTLFMLLHSAFSLVLSRYSNNSDIVIGTPVANRLQAELEPIIGFFVNTLVLRTNNNHNTLAEFWQHIREVNLSAQANQDITFEHLIEHCNVVRSDSHTPLYQVMFNMNNNELDTFEIDGVLFSSMDDITDLNEESVDISDDLYRLMFDEEDISSNDRKFVEPDLFLTAVDTDRGIELIWKYDSTLFNCESIERLNTYLTTLLENIVEKPLAKLTEVSMLPHQEQQKILSEFNNTPVIYPGENVIHQRFESVVKKASDQIAVVFQQERLTYQQVNSSANQLAEWLRQQGVKNNDLVGINAKRSAKFVIAILAILKAGGAYVPIDPANPVARVGQMIEDAAIDILLTESDELLTINDFNPDIIKNVHCFCLDNDWDELASFNQDNVAISVNEDSIAYMIYTSGSTGTPKGALVHHGGALNHIDAEFELMGFSNSAGQLLPHNFLQSAASSSDISVWQFIAPLVSGGKVVVLDTVTDIPQMIHLIQSEQVHFIELAPSVLQVLIDYLNEGSEYKYKLPVLRWLMTTAEPISIDFINQWLAIFPNIPIINGYGPTEASDDISYYIIKEPIINDGQSVPIGKPIANMSLYVLDEQQALVPVGCIGEICVSGKGVGKGYWRKPEKTAESFVENPYADGHAHGKTLYRTGDLGCWLPDGNIEFIGRNDNQVKIRGFRIELGEIEAALLSLPEVKQSAVITSESSGGNILLAAYVVLTNDEKSQQALDIIKTTLALHLPHYMLPSIYTILPEMPLSLANKIDRKKLPKPTALDKKQHYHGAVTDTECVLVSIWAQLLSINESDISTNADFFELGGHSLLAVKLITRVFQIKEVQLPVKVLFTHSTIFKLAKYIDESHSLADKVIRYSLTTLTANTKLPYVFLAPAMGMLSLSYKNLALALKEECNLSILTTPGIDELIVADSNLLHFSLSQRVEQWLEAVIEQQPSGHYRLIGHSFGGSIVFELANKLEALGNTVSIVFVESVLASSNFTEQSNLMNYFLPMSKSRKVNKNSLHKMLREFGLTPEKMEPEHFKLYTQATTTQAEIFYSYQPQVKIIGKTQLVFAAQGLGDYENKVEIIEHIQDWCVQNVSVTATPGDHLSVLKEPEFIFKIQEILFNKP
jgi:amino acid adenylation domain-containing protein